MTYTYECNNNECKATFSIEKGINEEVEIKCPGCNSKDVKRVYRPISPVWHCGGDYNSTRK